jgi:hypothetical protein
MAVAAVLDRLDLPEFSSLPDEDFSKEIDRKISEIISERSCTKEYYYGCTLLDGDHAPKITIGPVIFEPRLHFLNRLCTENVVSDITARRIRANWAGNKRRKRKYHPDFEIEKSILLAVGTSSTVCTVKTGDQSSKSSEPKALLVARLAMSAITLMYHKPSRPLAQMGLSFDGRFNLRAYAVSFGDRMFASSLSRNGIGHGENIGGDWLKNWRKFEPLLTSISEALNLYVDVATQTVRPKIIRALFMSLWWFHEACREEADLLAIAKFASAMDSLVAGKKALGIKNLIENRLGRKPQLAWFTDGKSPDDLIRDIYEITRNNVFHGSIRNPDRDWSGLRETSEFIARQVLVASLYWLKDNPTEADLKKLSMP